MADFTHRRKALQRVMPEDVAKRQRALGLLLLQVVDWPCHRRLCLEREAFAVFFFYATITMHLPEDVAET